VALRVKSRALTLKGSCELSMEHPDKAEQYFLEAINIMMDGVTQTNDYWLAHHRTDVRYHRIYI
jgi:hypothetical protein